MNKPTDLTILIPTMNRHEFLARALEYYKTTGFDGCIFIGDSSTGKELQKNEDLISNIKSLNIIHRIYPNPPHLHDGMVVQRMNEEVRTKYVAQTGDDDFFIVPNISKCIDFLEDNPDFVGAHGRRAGIKSTGDKPYGDLIGCIGWPEQNWIEENPLDRWIHYNQRPLSSQAWVFYADAWKRVYEKSDQVPCRYLGPEYLPCSIQAILGKSKELDFLTLVCQVGYLHQIFNFEKYPIFDLLCSDAWPQSIKVVKQTIIDAICGPKPTADMLRYVEITVWSKLWYHMIFFMKEQYDIEFASKEEKDQKNKDMRFFKSKHITIPDPYWKDYKDFKPVYEILIKDKPYREEVLLTLKQKEGAKENG